MIKLKKLIVESDEYDAREIEDLEGIETIVQYLTDHDKEPEIIDLGGDKYVIWDNNIVDPEFPIVEEKSDWVWIPSARRLREKLTDMIEERFNRMFWENPEPLYHGTPEENVETIKREGIKRQHKSRGLANRHIHSAVFTEKSPDYCQYHYGPEVFMIDTFAMKRDGFMPQVVKEPNHVESDVINFLAHKIGAWEEDRDYAQSQSEGTTEDTIIIYADIPPKYVTLL